MKVKNIIAGIFMFPFVLAIFILLSPFLIGREIIKVYKDALK